MPELSQYSVDVTGGKRLSNAALNAGHTSVKWCLTMHVLPKFDETAFLPSIHDVEISALKKISERR